MNSQTDSQADSQQAEPARRPVRRWRATAAVALASLVIGAGGGVALGALSASADDGGMGGRGGPGGFGGPGRGGAPFQQQGGQLAPPGAGGVPPSTVPQEDTAPDGSSSVAPGAATG